MPPPTEDLTKHPPFDRLTVEGPAPRKSGRIAWRCRCKCGKVVDVIAHNLLTHNTRSCGCLRRDRAREVCQRKGRAQPG